MTKNKLQSQKNGSFTKKTFSNSTQKKSLIRLFLIVCLSLFIFGVVMTIQNTAQAQEDGNSYGDKSAIDKSIEVKKSVQFIPQSPAQPPLPLIDIYRGKKFKGALDEEELKVINDLQTSDSLKRKNNKETSEGF